MKQEDEYFSHVLYDISIRTSIRFRAIEDKPIELKPAYHIELADLSDLKEGSEAQPFIKQTKAEGTFVEVHGVLSFYLTKDSVLLDIQHPDHDLAESVFWYNLIPLLLDQKNCLVFRGGAFASESSCTLVVGPSGIGLTSVLVGSMQNGGFPIADTYCSLKRNERGQVELIPSGMKLKVWKKTLSAFNIGDHGLPKFRKELDQYYFNTPNELTSLCHQADRIVFLSIAPGLKHEYESSSLNKMEAWEWLVKQSAVSASKRFSLEREKSNFLTLSSLLQNCKLFHLQRRVPSSNLNQLMHQINSLRSHE